MQKEIQEFLEFLNDAYAQLHTTYENLYWASYMGDHSVDSKFSVALKKRDAFCANSKLYAKVNGYSKFANGAEIERLKAWQLFFSKYQIPKELLSLRDKIAAIQSKIHKIRAKRVEGYIDPKTKKFVSASESKMRFIIRINPDEKIRKAAFDSCEKLAMSFLPDYVKMVKLINEYARRLGYPDFYSYKVQNQEGMTKAELFGIFDEIYRKTSYAFADVLKMEKERPGLRKPWNYSFMISGDFTKEQDPYFQFDDCLLRWGKSMAALGVDYRGSRLTLDLLDRKGKYSNGFCQWPKAVYYKNGRRIAGSSNFTSIAVYGQVGAGVHAMETLFHEGGHAAHYLNMEQTEICMNTEYPPAVASWAETQSMFMDTICSSIEWRIRYAKNKKGQAYPPELYQRMVEKFHKLNPLDMMGINMIINFERQIYEAKNLNAKKVLAIARKTMRKHSNYSADSLFILNVPHIYDWENICNYHGYGLAELAVAQWRDYFFKKYGYIVDNPNIAKEMAKVWALGASKTFKECVKIATGKKLTPAAYIKSITLPKKEILRRASQRIAWLKKVPEMRRKINLNAKIKMVHGKKEIANSSRGFEAMAKKYANWLHREYR